MNSGVMFSSKSDDWATPQDFFDRIDCYMHFTLDVCANKDNAKCVRFYSLDQDGLSMPWNGMVWCNPPYGRKVVQWVKKACFSDDPVVMLLPARTDTIWFHEYVLPFAKSVVFVRGRLKFGGSKQPAPFPCMVVFYRCFWTGGELRA